MSDDALPLSRSNTLIEITRTQFRETNSTPLSFSEILFNVFCAKVPVNQRTGLVQVRPWKVKEESAKIIDANRKRFERYLSGETAVPVDLEEAWVDCLLDKYRSRAIVALCGRYGAAAIELDRELDCDGLAEMTHRFARVLPSAGRILADGVVDEKDRPDAAEFVTAGKELMSIMGGLVNDMQARFGPDPSLRVGPRHSTH